MKLTQLFSILSFAGILFSQDVTLSFGAEDDDSVEIIMENNQDVFGFQFELTGLRINDASGGRAQDAGIIISIYMLTENTFRIRGINSSGDYIPAGDGILTNLTFETYEGDVCIDNGIISDPSGNSLTVGYGDCLYGQVDFIIGCNDVNAENYNADADGCNENDSSDFSCCEYEPDESHFNIELEETGEFQLIIIENSVTILEPGDEIGIFDANGVLQSTDPGEEPDYGEVLVGAGTWTDEQLSISSIMSVDLSDFGGPVLNGAIDGNPVVIKVWDASEGIESVVSEITWLTGSGNFGDLILAISEIELQPSHYEVELDETGDFQLVIFENSITMLESGDEIGIFDANGVLQSTDPGLEPDYGEVLVGAGTWTDEQLSISSIMSVDLSDFGGPVLNGAVDGNPVLIKVWKASEEMEYVITATWSVGSGIFGDLILAVSELETAAEMLPTISINEFFFRAASGTGIPDYVELVNYGEEDIDLSGWTIDDEDLSGTIPAGGYLLLAEDEPFFNADGDELYVGEDIPNSAYADISLSTSSDEILLLDADGNEIDYIAYDVDDGWPVGNDNRGHAVELSSAYFDNNNPGNWISSSESCLSDYLYGEDGSDEDISNFGSPGMENCNYDDIEVYIESSVTTSVDEEVLEDLDAFEEDFETFVETELDLPDGSVEVIDVTVDRDIEIIVDFIITLTEEELEETDYESTEDLGSDLEEIEEEIEDDGLEFIYGCADIDACNYNPDANTDDGSCTFPEGSCDCAGNPTEGYCDCIGNIEDCTGECGGEAVEDECGECNGDGIDEGECDCDGNIEDCAGECGGDAVEDCAGECGGDAVEDECGECNGDGIDEGACDCAGNVLDCTGECGGEAFIDDCGDCAGGTTGIDPCITTIDYSISLHTGANLISFWALPEDNSVAGVMASLGDNAIGVIGEGVAASHLGGGTWVGSLTQISPTSGYWIKLNTNDNLDITEATPTDPEIVYNLHAGANLISFPFGGSIDLSEGIPDDVEPSFIGVIGEGVAASQIAPFNWVGSLTEWSGTKGYWAKVEEDISFTFNSPALSYENEEYFTISLDYEQSMEQAFYFVKDIIIDDLNHTNYDLSVYCNGVLVGSREWTGDWIDIPAMGDDGEWYSDGYCQSKDIPKFTLKNQNTGSTIILAGNIPQWESNGLFIVETLAEAMILPEQITLNSAYPNPFNPETTIGYTVPNSQNISLKIYDITGREVTTLINGVIEPGYHEAKWNGTDIYGNEVAAGVYNSVLNSAQTTVTKKLVLLK